MINLHLSELLSLLQTIVTLLQHIAVALETSLTPAPVPDPTPVPDPVPAPARCTAAGADILGQ